MAEPHNEALIDGEWYWVRRDGPEEQWFPAKRDSVRAGGWTNEDTWEDFAGDVCQWRHIVSPKADKDADG